MTAEPLTHEIHTEPEATESSASKVLGLLAAMLRKGHGPVSLTEVSVAVGLPKSTTHRYLKVLEDHGFVERQGHLYCLGNSFLELGETARSSRFADLRDTAYPHLAALFERSGAIAVHLAVLQRRGRSIHYVDKLMRPDGVRLPTRVGGSFPATCTGLGKAMLAVGPAEVVEGLLVEPLPRATPRSVTGHGHLLAQLRRARDDGFVVEQEEACHGVVCVAAPILASGVPVAAVSLAVPSVTLGRSRDRRAAGLGRMVAASVRTIGTALDPAPTGDEDSATSPVRPMRPRRRIEPSSIKTRKEQTVVSRRTH